MATQQSPGERAGKVFMQHVRRARRRGEYALPTIRALAAEAGVSYVTMWKIVRQAKTRSFLTAAPSLETPARQPVARKERKWEWLRTALESSIVCGTYAPGTLLPASKELRERYGVCYRTLKRALDSMVRDGSVTPYKKTYRVSAPPTHRSYGTIVLLVRGSSDPAYHSPRFVEYLRSFEHECGLMQTRLRIVSYRYEGRKLVCSDRPQGLTFSEEELGGVLGFLMWTRGLDALELAGTMIQLSSLGRRVAVLDESGALRAPDVGALASRVRVFTPFAGVSAGASMGRYLLELGHTRIAYFSSEHATLWSRNRLKGLQRSYASAGLSEGVGVFTAENVFDRQRLAWLSQAVRRGLSVFRDSVDTGSDTGRHLRYVLDRGRAEPLRALLHTAVMGAAASELLNPLFHQASERDGITAWVGANDSTAFECMRYLARNGRDVPGDVSVVGFDDTLKAFVRDLTSYNFNVPAVMHAMVSHIVQPRNLSGRMAAGEQGGVRARGSSARARHVHP